MNTKNRNRFIVACVAAVVAVALGSAAWAQKQRKQASESDDGASYVGALPDSPKHRPWAKDVSLKRQRKARQIFYKANDLLVNQFFKQAADKYRQVIEVWDHPAVFYNLSLALLNLEQPVELYQALGQALRHGMPPLVTEANFERARKLRSLLEKQLSHIEIVCDEQGAKVTMNGKRLFVSPGSTKLTVQPGEHVIAADKEGFISDNRKVVLSPGKRETFSLKLYTVADLTEEYRRFPAWVPWTVTGGGAALLALGGIVHNSSRTGFQSYDDDFDDQCTAGCPDQAVPDLTDRLNSSVWRQRIAWSMYIAGGAAVTTGLVLVFLNRPETIRREIPGVETPAGLTAAPVVGPGAVGINASWRF